MLDSKDFSNMDPAKVEVIKQLYGFILRDHETFEEHNKNCSGCPICAGLRNMLKHVINDDRSIAGVPLTKVVQLRVENQQLDEAESISYLFPRRQDIYEDDGHTLSDYVYMVCKVKDFTDDDIVKYFRINPREKQKFKKSEFPDWDNRKNEYLNTYGRLCWDRWVSENPEKANRVSNPNFY